MIVETVVDGPSKMRPNGLIAAFLSYDATDAGESAVSSKATCRNKDNMMSSSSLLFKIFFGEEFICFSLFNTALAQTIIILQSLIVNIECSVLLLKFCLARSNL
jgi:hypothetical protein